MRSSRAAIERKKIKFLIDWFGRVRGINQYTYTLMMKTINSNKYSIFYGLHFTKPFRLHETYSFIFFSTNNIMYSTLINEPTNMYKKGEAFSKLQMETQIFNIPSNANFYNRIIKIIYNKDISLIKKQEFLEESIINYYHNHFLENILNNPDNLKYS